MHCQMKQSRYHNLACIETFVESDNISLLFIQVYFIVSATDGINRRGISLLGWFTAYIKILKCNGPDKGTLLLKRNIVCVNHLQS